VLSALVFSFPPIYLLFLILYRIRLGHEALPFYPYPPPAPQQSPLFFFAPPWGLARAKFFTHIYRPFFPWRFAGWLLHKRYFRGIPFLLQSV